MGCAASPTQTLTITPAFGAQSEGSNVSTSTYNQVTPYSTNCPGSLDSYCPFNGDRDLDKLPIGSTAWLYNITGNGAYLIWADEWMSASFGGPAVGPSSATPIDQTAGSCAGPNCDGYIVDYIAGLADCNAPNPPPCTSGGSPFDNMGKNFGEASGAPGADNELAWRLGGLSAAKTRTVYVGVNLASVHNATHVTVTMTQPSGAVATATCSTSPCAVQADARQGNHVAQVTYLSASGATLAIGDPVVIVVQ